MNVARARGRTRASGVKCRALLWKPEVKSNINTWSRMYSQRWGRRVQRCELETSKDTPAWQPLRPGTRNTGYAIVNRDLMPDAKVSIACREQVYGQSLRRSQVVTPSPSCDGDGKLTSFSYFHCRRCEITFSHHNWITTRDDLFLEKQAAHEKNSRLATPRTRSEKFQKHLSGLKVEVAVSKCTGLNRTYLLICGRWREVV